MSGRSTSLALSAALLLGCGACAGTTAVERDRPEETVEAVVPEPSAPSAAPVASSAPPAPVGPPMAYAAAIESSLSEVKAVRKLSLKEPVKSYSLTRDELLERAKKKMREELPPGVIEAQGEAFRALELIPKDYDLETGFLKLLQSRVAGFYDPDEKSMFLLEDLNRRQQEETLPHELVHVLQDQTFSIEKLLDYEPGKSDRLSAAQHLVEGDATLAGLMITYGEDIDIDTDALRSAFQKGAEASPVGGETPPFLVASLVSPYADGVAFVKELRAQTGGGWAGIDAAFKRLPETTEQTLHVEKYLANELAEPVPAIPAKALGKSFKAVLDEPNGELGLRLMLEQYSSFGAAAKAAEGWAGDRIVVFKDGKSWAVAVYTRMDSSLEAGQISAVLRSHFGKKMCRERKDLGPLAFSQLGEVVVIVAGPFANDGTKVQSAGTCKVAEAWAKEVLAAK